MMRGAIREILNGRRGTMAGRITAIGAGLIGFNIVCWLWALAAFRDHPVLLGTALLAYTFGLRHAVDADHIAAIDNVTRKLLQERRNSLGAGFFFSLGHSTVVVLMSIAVALTAATLTTHFAQLKSIGAVISTCVSAFFLLILAAANMSILLSIWRTFRAARRGEPIVE